MSVTVEAIEELAKAAIKAKCDSLGMEFEHADDAINFLFFGGYGFPGIVDGATLATAADNTAATDLTNDLALSIVTDSVKTGLGLLIDKFATKMLGGLEITGEELLGPAFLLFSAESIAPDPPIPGTEPTQPKPQFVNPFGGPSVAPDHNDPRQEDQQHGGEQFQNPFGNPVSTGPVQDPVAPTGDPTVDNSGADDEEDQDDHDEPVGPQDPPDVAPDRVPAEDEGDHDEGDHDGGDHDEGDHGDGDRGGGDDHEAGGRDD